MGVKAHISYQSVQWRLTAVLDLHLLLFKFVSTWFWWVVGSELSSNSLPVRSLFWNILIAVFVGVAASCLLWSSWRSAEISFIIFIIVINIMILVPGHSHCCVGWGLLLVTVTLTNQTPHQHPQPQTALTWSPPASPPDLSDWHHPLQTSLEHNRVQPLTTSRDQPER